MIYDKLTNDERVILELLRKNGRRYTKQAMGDVIGKSLSTVNRVIRSLTEKGLIERVGSNKTGYWISKS